MQDYKLPYFAKTGVNEAQYQQALGEALRTAGPSPVLLMPPARTRGPAWRNYRRHA